MIRSILSAVSRAGKSGCIGRGHRKDFGNIWMKRLDFRHVANLIMDLRDAQALSNILRALGRI
jgi:hypothetical protein